MFCSYFYCTNENGFVLTSSFSSVAQNNEKLQDSQCIFELTQSQADQIRNARYDKYGLNSFPKFSAIHYIFVTDGNILTF